MTKLLIAGDGRRVEIVNLEDADEHCDQIQSLRLTTQLATGQFFDGKPIICGGIGNECQCQVFQNGSWDFTPNPSKCRYDSASAILTNSVGKDILFIVGGFYEVKYRNHM